MFSSTKLKKKPDKLPRVMLAICSYTSWVSLIWHPTCVGSCRPQGIVSAVQTNLFIVAVPTEISTAAVPVTWNDATIREVPLPRVSTISHPAALAIDICGHAH